jgi:predicted phosphodiesterase
MTKWMAIPDLHAPITSQTFFNWMIGQIEDFKPDYIINIGDWFEGKPSKRFSKWPGESWTLEQEKKEVARQAHAINSAAPNATKVWIYGNHDFNQFGDDPDRVPADYKDCVHWRNHVATAEALKDWTVIERYSHRTAYRLGPVTFQHGCDVAKASMQRASYLYGGPNCLYVCGHTHRPCDVTQAEHLGIKLPYWWANPGTGADWDWMRYMDRMSMADWGRGVVLGEVSDSAVSNRKATYSSPQWAAITRVHSWAHDRHDVRLSV